MRNDRGAILLALLVIASLGSAGRVAPPDPRTLPAFQEFRASLADAAAATPAGGTLYLRNRPFPSIPFDAKRPERFPGWAAVFVLSHQADTIDGRAVRFVEADRQLVSALRAGRSGRVKRLVTTEAECGTCDVR